MKTLRVFFHTSPLFVPEQGCRIPHYARRVLSSLRSCILSLPHSAVESGPSLLSDSPLEICVFLRYREGEGGILS